MSIKEFDSILDDVEKNMDDPDTIFAFVLLCSDMFAQKNKHMRIQEMLDLKEKFDQHIYGGPVPMFDSLLSRKAKRSMQYSSKHGSSRKGKKKK